MDFDIDNPISFSRKVHYVNLGPWRLYPKYRTLEDGKRNIELEPLLFCILVHLINNNDRIVPRQELIEEVWKQKYVDDNAINRALSALRKALKSEKQRSQVIKTHYRLGYSLAIVPELVYFEESEMQQVDASETTHPWSPDTISLAHRTESHRTRFGIVWIFLLCLFGSAIPFSTSYLFSRAGEDPNLPVLPVTETLLSWKQGLSVVPLMSKNQDYVAYSFKKPNQAFFDVFVKNTKTLEDILVSDGTANAYPLAWSKDNQLVYQRVIERQSVSCEVWRVDISDDTQIGNHQKLFNCFGNNLIHADITDNGNTLLYTKFNYRNIPNLSSIVQRDLTTNTEFQISSPPITEFGDYFVRLSNLGDKVAILRHQAKGMKILIANSDGSNVREAASVDYFVDSISWSEDDLHLHWLKREDAKLATLSIDTAELSYQAFDSHSLTGGKVGLDLINHSTMIVATDYADSNLYQWESENDELSDFSNTHFIEIDASAFHNSNRILYLLGWMKQSLWVAENGSRRQVIVSLEDNKIKHLEVSPDDAMIAMANKEKLYLYQTRSFTLEDEVLPPGLISDVAWMDDDDLILTLEQQGRMSAWRYNIDSKMYSLIVTDAIYNTKLINHSELVYLNKNHSLIKYNLDTGDKHTLLSRASTRKLHWDVNDDYLYYSDDAVNIYRISLKHINDAPELIVSTRDKEVWKLNANNHGKQPALFLTLIESKNNMLVKLTLDH